MINENTQLYIIDPSLIENDYLVGKAILIKVDHDPSRGSSYAPITVIDGEVVPNMKERFIDYFREVVKYKCR